MGLAARFLTGVVLMLTVLTGCAGKGTITPPEDIEPGQMFAKAGHGGDLSAVAADAGYVLVGEGHTVFCDHKVQAEVINSLAELGPAIGLEMVSVERQYVLDLFNKGEMRISELRKALNWDETWGHPFRLYVPVFGAARKHGLKLYALNAPRCVIDAVSEGGLEGVAEEDRRYLPEKVVPPADEQMEELRAVYEGHGHGKKDSGDKGAGTFERFILIQSLWDSVMAGNAVRVRRETGAPVIVLAGSGHVRYGLGIARRIEILDPSGEVLTVMPWRGMDEADEAAGDVFFYCPPTHTAQGGYTMAFRPDGVFVSDVEPGGPAEAAGFREGDRIVGLEGKRITNFGELFRTLIFALKDGDVAAFMLERDGGLVVGEIDFKAIRNELDRRDAEEKAEAEAEAGKEQDPEAGGDKNEPEAEEEGEQAPGDSGKRDARTP